MGGASAAPLFDVNVFNGTFSTEFTVARVMDVPSNGLRVVMPLRQHEDTARLAVRTSPAIEPQPIWWPT